MCSFTPPPCDGVGSRGRRYRRSSRWPSPAPSSSRCDRRGRLNCAACEEEPFALALAASRSLACVGGYWGGSAPARVTTRPCVGRCSRTFCAASLSRPRREPPPPPDAKEWRCAPGRVSRPPCSDRPVRLSLCVSLESSPIRPVGGGFARWEKSRGRK